MQTKKEILSKADQEKFRSKFTDEQIKIVLTMGVR